MIQIEVKSTVVNEKRGTARASGKPFLIREQAAWLDTGKAFPVEVKISLDDLAPFPPGKYVVGKECFYVQRYGDVGVDLKHMRPMAAAVQPATLAGGVAK